MSDEHETRPEQRPIPTTSGDGKASGDYRYFSTRRIKDSVVAQVVDCFLQGEVLAEMMRLELLQIVDSSPCTMLIIDFQNVRMITSVVISALLLLERQLAARQISLRLCSVATISDVFGMMYMDQTIAIFDCLDSALAAPNPTPWYSDVCDRLSPPDDEI